MLLYFIVPCTSTAIIWIILCCNFFFLATVVFMAPTVVIVSVQWKKLLWMKRNKFEDIFLGYREQFYILVNVVSFNCKTNTVISSSLNKLEYNTEYMLLSALTSGITLSLLPLYIIVAEIAFFCEIEAVFFFLWQPQWKLGKRKAMEPCWWK